MKGGLDAGGQITNAENQRNIALEMRMQALGPPGCAEPKDRPQHRGVVLAEGHSGGADVALA